MIDKSKLGTPITVYLPNGAIDEYYTVDNKPYKISYFTDGWRSYRKFLTNTRSFI